MLTYFPIHRKNDVNDLDVIIKPKYWEFGRGGKYRTEDIEFFNNWPGFDVDEQESAKYIKYWFGDVHGLKKVGDIRKFIP